MRYVLAAALAGLVAPLAIASAPAAPAGSYQQSCRDISIEGGVLTGTCRTQSGRWARAALGDVNRCAGDIANLDGSLTCGGRAGVLPLYGSGQPPAARPWRRQRQQRLRCQGIVDPVQRERCFRR
jgi:hypothetical protein